MLKPPHPIARAAYALAMSVNPNNHALDGGRASSRDGVRGGRRAGEDVRRFRGISAISPAAVPSPTSKRYGSRASCNQGRAHGCLRPGPLHPYPHLRRARPASSPSPADDTGRMDLDCTRTCARDARHRHRCGHARHHCRRRGRSAGPAFWSCSRSTASASTLTQPTAATSCSPAISAPEARAAFDADPARGLARRRSAQARPATLWLRLHPLPRPHRRPLLQARFALHLFHLEGPAPRPDLAGVLARRSLGGRAVGYAAAAAVRTPAASSRGGSKPDAKRRWPCAQRLAADPRFVLPIAPPALDILFWARAAQSIANPPPARRRFSTRPAGATSISPSPLCRPASFPPEPGPIPRTRSVTCLRSVMMKPEHLRLGGRDRPSGSTRPRPPSSPASIPTNGQFSGIEMITAAPWSVHFPV